MHGSYVTCCKTSLSWAGKTRNTLYFLQQIFATCKNLICCKTGVNLASSNVVKQVARFVAHLTVTLVGPTSYPASLFFQGTGRTEKPRDEIAEIISTSSHARTIFLILKFAISLLYIRSAYHRKKLYTNQRILSYCAVIYGNLRLIFLL